jgi:aldose 1-epimerase
VSGDQHVVRAAGYEATVASVGASLRSLRHHGRDLVVPFGADELRPALRGAVLAPWPNRTGDGRYTVGGVEHRLALSEPELGHAAHGLVAWSDFALVDDGPSHVRLAATVEPQPGYPWRLRVEVRHAVGADGLAHEVTATNESGEPAPVGLGCHPYLVAGPPRRGAVDGWTLALPAATALVTDERLLPVAEVPVDRHAGGVLDFRTARTLRGAVLNHAYTGLRRDADGMARVRVLDGDGCGVELAADAGYRWVQAYTADGSPGSGWRSGIAVEPMTCPPDALRSGRDLVLLAPGESTSARWTLRAVVR